MNRWNIYFSPPGVISDNGVWVLIHRDYMYTGDTLFGLLYIVLTEWKENKHFIGF